MRTLLKVMGVLLVVVVLALFWVANNLGGLVKKGVETYAPPVLGTVVTLEHVMMMPFSGAGSIKGLAIAQPAGFGDGYALAVGEVSLGVDVGSLRAEPIVVRRIVLDKAVLNYVQTADSNNVQALVRNIEHYSESKTAGEQDSDETKKTGQPDDGTPDSSATPSRKMIIDELTISHVSVTASSPLLPGQSASVLLAPIEFHHLGRAEGGLTLQQLLARVAQRLNAEVQQSVTDSDEFNAMLKDVGRKKAREEIDRTLDRELGGEGAKQIKGWLDRL